MSSGPRERPALETPGRPLAHTSGPRLLLAIVATLLGWIVVSVGLGVGLPRAGDGVAGTTLTLVPLVVGMTLVAIAGTLLFHAVRSWARLILAPWSLAVLVGLYCLSLALAAVYPPHASSDASLPADATRVEMISADGERLAGWYLPSHNGAAVVLRHGAGSTTADVMQHARVLNDAGYGVLATDARGHGESGGQAMDLGWYGELDTQAAVDLLADRRDVDAGRIGVVGLSMGAEEGIGAAGVDRRIRAVVAEGATGRTAADKAWLADEYGVLGLVQGVLDAGTYGLVDLLTPADPPPTLEASVHHSSPTAMLLIAAGDRPDEESVAVRLAALDPSRVQVWVVSGAGHVAALRTDPADWREHVIGFLDAALRVEPHR
ncbi:alpha/beta hydrolase [Microbacterium pumilum]|uniref:alpha/beta hydrolase n=1 Tax=Microbacterium pumilum TaxID=344165 RepID=UPI0031DBE044